jgi:Glycosyltransferase 61
MTSAVVFGARESCTYTLRNDWDQPLGRMSEFIKPFEIAPSYYVEVPNARLVSRHLVGIDNRYKLIEEMLPFKKLSKRARLKSYALSCLPPSHSVETTLCSLISPWGWHNLYYHWFLDYLPVVFATEKYTSLTGRPVKLLVPSNLKEWQSKSLSQLGYEGDSLLRFTPGTGYTSVKTRCIVASHSHRCQKASSVRPAKAGIPFDAVSPSAIAELRERLSPKRSELRGSVLPKKILLSRRDATSRRLVNEHEVLSLLSRYGFEAVTLEGVSLSTQIELFKYATHIVAVHGAGLTNILHSYQASVLEIHSLDHGIKPDYFQIAYLNKCRYFFYVCQSQGLSKDVFISMNVIKDFLDATV